MGSVADSMLKLDWARHYLDILEKSAKAFIQDPESYAFRIQPKPDSLNYQLVGRIANPCPTEWALLAGDISNNVRCALDYIVDRISSLPIDSQARYKIGFPVCVDIPRWRVIGHQQFHSRKMVTLKGVSDADIGVIERFQPYNGLGDDDPLAILQRINNGDKHHAIRVVTAVSRRTGFELRGIVFGHMRNTGTPLTRMRGHLGDLGLYHGRTGAFVSPVGNGVVSEAESVLCEFYLGSPHDPQVNLESNLAIEVRFATGQPGLEHRPVISCMRAIIDRAKEIVETFS